MRVTYKSSFVPLQALIVIVTSSFLYICEYRILTTQLYPTPNQPTYDFLNDDNNHADMAQQLNRRLQQISDIENGDSIDLHRVATPTLLHQLPMFNETGGLIVFLHIAKTGGSTIRQGLKPFPNVDVKRVFDEEQLNLMKDKIDWYLSSNNNKTTNMSGMEKVLLLELHGNRGEPITIFQLHSYIQSWKARATAYNKKIFIFTLFREPASFHVSYFTFFKHPLCRKLWCDRPVLPQTERNLMRSMIPNHQCQYLARKFNKKENRMVPVTRQECESVYTLLKADVDWIGTMETMHVTTLPLLAFIVSGNNKLAHNFTVVNQQNKLAKLQLNDISSVAQEQIRNASMIDRYLYDSTIREYSLDMWQNYVKS
jgi:hypothetical protein